MLKALTRPALTAAFLAAAVSHAPAASVAKTYSYFTIGGNTLEDIEKELTVRGPKVNSTGRRHPGATQMEFTSKLGYAENNGRCQITKATVTVKAKVILPRWGRRSGADPSTQMVWDTLSADIKRHEESHVSIAKNHARELEDKLKKLGRFKTCKDAAEKAKQVTAKILGRHDREQDKFDYVEGVNFERRLLRLLKYRMGMAVE